MSFLKAQVRPQVPEGPGEQPPQMLFPSVDI